MSGILQNIVVRIINKSGSPVGAGCIVSRRHIITCAHVILSALELDASDEEVLGRELLVESCATVPPTPLRVKVSLWDQDQDIAGLELIDTIDTNIYVQPLIVGRELWGHSFRVFGFPRRRDEGAWAYGVLRSRQLGGSIQLDGVDEVTHRIEVGFSGTPVWDDQLGGIVGIVSMAERSIELRVALMIPTELLHQSWPEVVPLRLLPEASYLEQLVKRASSSIGIASFVDLTYLVEVEKPTVQPFIDHGVQWPSEFRILAGDTRGGSVRTSQGQLTKTTLKGLQAVFDTFPRFVILGGLGTGKTTTIHRFVFQLAQRRQFDPRLPIPLLVDLSNWPNEENTHTGSSKSTDLKTFIASHWQLEGDVFQKLAQGEIVLFLDGLNEMGPSGRLRAGLLREWIQSNHAPQYIIVTCREEDYTNDMHLPIPSARLQSLSDIEVKEFIDQYFQTLKTYSNNFEMNANILSHSLISQPSLLQLARKPYYLSAIIYIYTNTGSLPNKAGLILAQLVSIILDREKQQRIGILEQEDLTNKFGRIAFNMLGKNQEVSYQWVVKVLTGKLTWFLTSAEREKINNLLNFGNSVGFITIKNNNIRFTHQLIQSFFIASYIISGDRRSYLWSDIDDASINEWHDIIQIIADLSSEYNIAKIQENLTTINPFLFLEILSIYEYYFKYIDTIKLAYNLIDHIKPDKILGQNYIFEYFSKFGPKLITPLIEILQDNSVSVSRREKSAWLLGELKYKEAIPHLMSLASGENIHREQISRLSAELAPWDFELKSKSRWNTIASYGASFLVFAASALLAQKLGISDPTSSKDLLKKAAKDSVFPSFENAYIYKARSLALEADREGEHYNQLSTEREKYLKEREIIQKAVREAIKKINET